MKRTTLTTAIILSTLLMMISCSSKKASISTTNRENHFDGRIYNAFVNDKHKSVKIGNENILMDMSSDTSTYDGSMTLNIQLNNLKIDEDLITGDLHTLDTFDNNWKFVNFNDTVGIHITHYKVNGIGNIKHHFKWSLLLKDKGHWVPVFVNNDFSPDMPGIGKSIKTTYSGSITSGTKPKIISYEMTFEVKRKS